MTEPNRAGTRLDSWKAIAAHLGREVRTVQRWERSEGLPVHRLEHQKRGSVYAFSEELDAWRRQRDPQAPDVAMPAEGPAPAPRPGWAWRSLGLAAVLLGMAGLVLYWRKANPPPEAQPKGGLNGNWQQLFAASTAAGGRYRLLAAGPAPGALALAAGGSELYVANVEARTLTVLDTRALRAVSTIRLGERPMVLAANGERVLAGGPDGLEAVDIRTQRVSPVAVGGGVYDIAVTPDGRFAYLAERFDGLERLDLARLEVEHIATPSCPSVLALSPKRGTLYVGYQCGGPAGGRGHDSIGVWDMAQARFTAALAGDVPLVATAMAVSPDGNELWVSGGDVCTAAYDHRGCPAGATGLVYVYSTATRKRLHTLALRTGAVNQLQFIDGGRLALLDAAVFDTTRYEALERLPDTVSAIVTVPAHARAFASLPQRGAVAVFDAPCRLCTPPTTDLVAWWRGDGSGADAWGNLGAQAAAGQEYAPGLTGQAFAFRGGPDVDLGHDVSLQPAGFTVGAWVRAEGSGAVFSRGARGRGWSLGFNAAHQIEFCAETLPSCRALPGWPLGTWHHLALASAEGGEVSVYGDGRALARFPLRLSAMAPGADLELGRGWTGRAGAVVFYARPLRAGELAPLLAQPACLAAAERHSPARGE